jgi:hypothetical protein
MSRRSSQEFPGFREGNLIQIEARLASSFAGPLRKTPHEKIILVHFSGKHAGNFITGAGKG